MADLEHVLDVLTATVEQIVYPNGTGLPSIIAAPIKIYPGWPTPDVLDSDIAKGEVHISIFPSDLEYNTTRYLDEWVTLSIPSPTITLTASGMDVTVGGSIAVPQNVALIVDNKAVAYAIQPGDTLAGIATALVALLTNQGVLATNVGPVLTLPQAKKITARVGMWGTSYREWANQERIFCITIWAPTPEVRRVIGPPIDLAIKKKTFINLPDGTQGRIRYKDSPFIDRFEKHDVYRRDLRFTVDWATVELSVDPQITITEINLLAPDGLLLKQLNL